MEIINTINSLEDNNQRTIRVYVGTRLGEGYGGYTLSARMPDGRLTFKGPRFVEEADLKASKLKLIALKYFLDSVTDIPSRGDETIEVMFCCNDSELCKAWSRQKIENFRNAENPRLWREIRTDLKRKKLTLTVFEEEC